jgi:hypothetical protein
MASWRPGSAGGRQWFAAGAGAAATYEIRQVAWGVAKGQNRGLQKLTFLSESATQRPTAIALPLSKKIAARSDGRGKRGELAIWRAKPSL